MRTAVERGWDEREVSVNRQKLLVALKENRKKHISDYIAAVAGYKVQATKRLAALKTKIIDSVNDNFSSIQSRIERFDPDDPLQDKVVLTSVTSFDLQVPRSHEEAYDVAIQMAEWEVSETITLTQSQFECFVLDSWDWKTSFDVLNKSYSQAR